MESIELLDIIDKGEDSKVQFKENIHNADQLAQEMVAFSNSQGGIIVIGVDDNSNIIGLDSNNIKRINQLISNTASQNVKDPISPFTEIIKVNNKKLLVLYIKEGIQKPYATNKGVHFIKSGADKRKVSREELLRLFQESKRLNADEMIIQNSSVEYIDKDMFLNFFKEQYNEKINDSAKSLEKIMTNLNLLKGNHLNLACLLLFGKKPENFKPAFIVKAVNYYGNDIEGTEYRDSQDIKGNLIKQFNDLMGFLNRNLKKIQKNQNFNSEGIWEVSKIALEELIVNAFVHRDYFINAPIRVLIFDNRIEIISPGKLPNNLTVDNIKYGNSCIRNSILVSFASKILPYRGLASGILRVLKECPKIELINDTEVEQFKAIIPRIK